jgi:hypothetical protein
MAFWQLTSGLLALSAVAVASGADQQERLSHYEEACPDYAHYAAYPQ